MHSEALQAKTQPDSQAQMLIITRDATRQNASELQASQETGTPSPVDNSGCNGNPVPACAAEKFTFNKYGMDAATQVCCSEESTACTGCKTTGAGGWHICADGYRLLPDNSCASCVDAAGWQSEAGRSCFQLSSSSCSDEKVDEPAATRHAASEVVVTWRPPSSPTGTENSLLVRRS